MCKIESMERLIESGYDTPDVDVFFDELKAEYKSEGLLWSIIILIVNFAKKDNSIIFIRSPEKGALKLDVVFV